MNSLNLTLTAKHICNSQNPAHKPKIAKELVCLPPLTLPTQKTKSFKDRENGMTELRTYLKSLTEKKNALLVTSCKRNCPAAGATQGNLRLHEDRYVQL